MSVAHFQCRAQIGLDAPLVRIEAHLGAGLPAFSVVGLPAPVVRESRERVRSALLNAGYEFPAGRITVNLAPVDLAKEGGRYDLAVALALLAASGQIQPRVPGWRLPESRLPGSPEAPEWPECYGELGLDGSLRPVRGLLLAAVHAAREGRRMLVPRANLAEIERVSPGLGMGLDSLREVCEVLAGRAVAPAGEPGPGGAELQRQAVTVPMAGQKPSLDEVKGQFRAKRALVIAAAGAHSLLMVGPPGSGKSLLAARLPGLLPPLAAAEALEAAGIASLSAQGFDAARWAEPPFRAPHHSASAAAIVGGGPRLRPGEISLAHHGVLFLDELPEFDRRVLESLREPLETGQVTIARSGGRLELPARFQLVAAMNPCPCGYQGDPQRSCRCGPGRVQRYRERLSGPLLDRIDLHIDVPRPGLEALVPGRPDDGAVEPTAAALAQAVHAARQRAIVRQGCLNALLDAQGLAQHCALEAPVRRLVERVAVRFVLSARGLHRLLRVARTIADLADEAAIGVEHVGEAAGYRSAGAQP
jgi:magnesium chelatase family protein